MTTTLYAHILRGLGDPLAFDLEDEFVASEDERRFMRAVLSRSEQELRSIVSTCISVVTDDQIGEKHWIGDALYILHLCAADARMRKIVVERRGALDAYIRDPRNLDMWCQHLRGSEISDDELRADAGTVLSLESLLRKIGPDTYADLRAEIASKAIDPVLRERILGNVGEGF